METKLTIFFVSLQTVNADTVEIERKFLVRGEFKPFATASLAIKQGYLCCDAVRTVRVRTKGEKGYITVKGRNYHGGLARFEWEKEITAAEAEALLALANPGVIDKVRHLVPSEDGVHTWEVDEFHGENEGLVMAEIELGSETETFPLPEWIGEEVTGDKRYYNSYLSIHPYKTWK